MTEWETNWAQELVTEARWVRSSNFLLGSSDGTDEEAEVKKEAALKAEGAFSCLGRD